MPKLYIYLLIWLHFPNSHSKGQKISKANYGILFIGKMMILGALFGCGDAVATVAAQASTGTEFFMTDMTRGRLNFQQRNFAGNRYSDHIAQFNAFQCW